MTKILVGLSLSLALAACHKSAPPAKAAKPVAQPSCEDPTPWLALIPVAKFEDQFCAACSDSCGLFGDTGSLAWSFLHDDPSHFSTAALAEMQATIRAQFGSEPLTDIARENIAYIDGLSASVKRKYENKVGEQFRADITEWLSKKDSAPLPPTLFVDGEKADSTRFRDFVHHGGEPVFELSKYTVLYVDHDLAQLRFPERTVFAIQVGSGARVFCVDRSGVDCEGYESIVFFFEVADGTRELIAISVSAAG